MPAKRMSRRRFLKRSLGGAAAVAAFSIVPRYVLGGEAGPAPSDMLTHAIIGVGGMGSGHIGYCLNDKTAKLLAVSDVDKSHLASAVKKAGGSCTGYADFRQVLDRGDIDIIHRPRGKAHRYRGRRTGPCRRARRHLRFESSPGTPGRRPRPSALTCVPRKRTLVTFQRMEESHRGLNRARREQTHGATGGHHEQDR